MKKILCILCIGILTILPMHANAKETVTLKRCVDGDTAHFQAGDEYKKVRFLAINTPEYTKKKEPYGKEASEFVCTLLTNATKIELEYDDGSSDTDKYGRTLAWVYADGIRVEDEVVKRGLAEVTYIYGKYAYTDELYKLQEQAQKNKLNIWSDFEPAQDNIKKVKLYAIGCGIVLILAGIFFVKAKRKKKKLLRKKRH